MTAAELRNGVHLLTGGGGNVVAMRGRDTAVVVDSGSAARSEELEAVLRERAGIEASDIVFNTHWHESHTGGNELLRGPGTKIVAHENTRLWMSTEYYVRWEDRTYRPRSAGALPDMTFRSHEPQPIRLDTGDIQTEYAHLENAHTDGDIYVRFPEANVLVAGGAVTVGEYPLIDYSTGGWIDGLISATEKLRDLVDAETLIIPAAGPAVGRGHLSAQHEMASALRERVAEQMRLGRGVDEILGLGLSAEFDAEWGAGGNGEQFIANIYADLAWRGPGGAL